MPTWIYGLFLLLSGLAVVREGVRCRSPEYFEAHVAGKWVAKARISQAARYYSLINIIAGLTVAGLTILGSLAPAWSSIWLGALCVVASMWTVLYIAGLWLFSKAETPR